MPGKPVKSFEPTEEELKELEELKKKYEQKINQTCETDPKKDSNTPKTKGMSYDDVQNQRKKIKTNLDYFFYIFIFIVSVGYLCFRSKMGLFQLIKVSFPREYTFIRNLFHPF